MGRIRPVPRENFPPAHEYRNNVAIFRLKQHGCIKSRLAGGRFTIRGAAPSQERWAAIRRSFLSFPGALAPRPAPSHLCEFDISSIRLVTFIDE